MTTIIKVFGLATGEMYRRPMYVEYYDADGHDGRGDLVITRDIARAKRYANAIEAMEDWKRQSTTRPSRLDGKPNRPLTAYTVEVMSVDE